MTRRSPISRRRGLEARRARPTRRRRSTILAAAFAAGATARAATFTVTSSADSGPGTLRQAILDANATPGADTISFDLGGSGIHTLVPAASLPVVTDPITLDGWTQPGSSPNSGGPGQADDSVHLIEIDGTNSTDDRACITVGPGGTGSVIRGFVINRCPGDGILLLDSGGSNTVAGNFIGTDPTGSTPMGNAIGVTITKDSTGNTIGGMQSGAGNLIAFNVGNGVTISSTATSPGSANRVLANSIHSNGGLGIDLVGDGVTPNDQGDGDEGPNHLHVCFKCIPLAPKGGFLKPQLLMGAWEFYDYKILFTDSPLACSRHKLYG